MSLITDYIISLTNLYGIVHKEKVAEIYNMQNQDEITLAQIEDIMENQQAMLKKHFVYIDGNYFIHESIMDFGEFDSYMKQKAGKPFYIPNKPELLKYKNQFYFEKTKEFQVLEDYVVKELTVGDRKRAYEIAENIQGLCQVEASTATIINNTGHLVDFKSKKQVSEIMDLVVNLSNNTRIWSNNGYTPNELFKSHENNMAVLSQNGTDNQVKKIGRNDPCPCGSGKKYKKCCL